MTAGQPTAVPRAALLPGATALAERAANDPRTVRPARGRGEGDAARPEPLARGLAAYRGVAVSVERSGPDALFRLELLHEDPRLSLPLSVGTDAAAVAREWQAWGAALDLPLLAVQGDGRVHAELTAFGRVLAERSLPRRAGSPLVGRRSRYGRRRRAAPVRPLGELAVHAGEREIIART